MIPRQAALKIHGVGRADRPVGREFNGRALHERAGGHDDLRIVTRHGPGDGVDIAVHGRGRLDALAEGDHALRRAELHALDDVVPRLGRVRDAAKAQPLIDIRREHRALERAGRHGRGEEEALIKRRHEPEVRADLLPEARGAQTVGAAVDQILTAADVPADGREPAAGVLDERADDHVRAEVGRLDRLDELAVAVVDHADDVRVDALAERDQLADLLHGKRRPRGVALRALDGHELHAAAQRLLDGRIVKAVVRQQVDLPVVHAVFLERAGARADADDLLERVIRRADGAEQRVAGQEVGAERHGQRVRAAGDLGAHERGLRVEAVGIDALEIVAPGVVVAVARGGGKVRRVDAVFLHRADDLALVVFRDAVDLVKPRAQTGEHLLAEAVHRRRDAERGVHGLCIHRSSPYIIRQIRRKFLRPRRA